MKHQFFENAFDVSYHRCTFVSVCVSIHLRTYRYMCLCMYVCTSVCMYVSIYLLVNVCMFSRMHDNVLMYLCNAVYVCGQYISMLIFLIHDIRSSII